MCWVFFYCKTSFMSKICCQNIKHLLLTCDIHTFEIINIEGKCLIGDYIKERVNEFLLNWFLMAALYCMPGKSSWSYYPVNIDMSIDKLWLNMLHKFVDEWALNSNSLYCTHLMHMQLICHRVDKNLSLILCPIW